MMVRFYESARTVQSSDRSALRRFAAMDETEVIAACMAEINQLRPLQPRMIDDAADLIDRARKGQKSGGVDQLLRGFNLASPDG